MIKCALIYILTSLDLGDWQVSRSTVKFTTIEYAGMGRQRELTGAITSYSVPPKIDHVTIMHSLYAGMNFTLPDSFVNIRNTVVKNNAGM